MQTLRLALLLVATCLVFALVATTYLVFGSDDRALLADRSANIERAYAATCGPNSQENAPVWRGNAGAGINGQTGEIAGGIRFSSTGRSTDRLEPPAPSRDTNQTAGCLAADQRLPLALAAPDRAPVNVGIVLQRRAATGVDVREAAAHGGSGATVSDLASATEA